MVGDRVFRRPKDGEAIGFLRNFQPQNQRSNDFLVSTTRSLSFWDNVSLYCYELRVDGSVNVASSYHNSISEIWRNFSKGGIDRWSGDLIHDVGQVISCSPDGSMVAFRYGDLVSGATDGKAWRIDVWKRAKTSFERIAQFDDPFPSRSDLCLKWSPSSRFILVFLSDYYDAYIVDLKDNELRSIFDGNNGNCTPAWHSNKDLLVVGLTEESGLHQKHVLSFWEPGT